MVLGPQGLDGVELVLASAPESAPVVGRVLDVAGRPVAGALVRAEHTGPPRGRTVASAETEEDGSFRLDRLSGQRMTLVAWHPGAGFGERESS